MLFQRVKVEGGSSEQLYICLSFSNVPIAERTWRDRLCGGDRVTCHPAAPGLAVSFLGSGVRTVFEEAGLL